MFAFVTKPTTTKALLIMYQHITNLEQGLKQ